MSIINLLIFDHLIFKIIIILICVFLLCIALCFFVCLFLFFGQPYLDLLPISLLVSHQWVRVPCILRVLVFCVANNF